MDVRRSATTRIPKGSTRCAMPMPMPPRPTSPSVLPCRLPRWNPTLHVAGGSRTHAFGKRFSNEASGYSEQAFEVIRQPDGIAFNIYDERCEKPALDFTDYREVAELGGIKKSDTIAGLARMLGLPQAELERTFAEVDRLRETGERDEWGRQFAAKTALIALYFMRLRYQPGLVRLFAGAGLFWLAILMVLSLADFFTRAWPV